MQSTEDRIKHMLGDFLVSNTQLRAENESLRSQLKEERQKNNADNKNGDSGDDPDDA